MLAVLDIEDTRHKDPEGRIIPDSGDPKPCDFCGRCHQVHHLLSDGRRVGATCAKKIGVLNRSPRYLILHRQHILGPIGSQRALTALPDAGWIRSFEAFAASNPFGIVSVADLFTKTTATYVGCGKVNMQPEWEYQE